MIITIDGYSCLGKSCIGKDVAKRIGIDFLSTGMLIRFVASVFAGLQSDIIEEEAAVKRAVEITEMTEVEEIIKCSWLKDSIVELSLPIVVKYPFVDERLQAVLRKYVSDRDILLDGRFTFLIFPDAYRKYYFQSSVVKRAELLVRKRGMCWEEAMSYLSFRDSFEKRINIPETVKVLDPFSKPFGMSKDDLLKYILSDIL